MDSEKPHSLRSLLTRIVGTLIGVLPLYVLSAGPATYAGEKYPRTKPVVTVFIRPVHWAVNDTALERSFYLYEAWWWFRGAAAAREQEQP